MRQVQQANQLQRGRLQGALRRSLRGHSQGKRSLLAAAAAAAAAAAPSSNSATLG